MNLIIIFRQFAFIILFLVSTSIFANAIELSTHSVVEIQQYIVLSQNPQNAQSAVKQRIDLEKQKSPFWSQDFWLQLDLNHPSAGKQEFILVLDNADYPQVDFFVAGDSGLEKIAAGRTVTLEQRIIRSDDIAIPILFRANEQKTIFIHLKSYYRYNYSILAYPRQMYYQQRIYHYLFKGGLTGIFLTLILLGAILFFYLREWIYLYFILYAASFLCFFFLKNNFQLFVFRPLTFGELDDAFLILLIAITGWFLLFSKSFLDLKSNFPRLNLFYILLFWISALILGVKLFLHTINPIMIGIIVSLTLLTSFLLGFISYFFHKNHTSRFYLLSFLPIFLVILVDILSSFGIFINSFKHGLEIGLGLEMFILSFAIVDRYRYERVHREQLERNLVKEIEINYRREQEYSEILQKKVEERTKELKQKNHALKQANLDKDRLFSIISHDLRSPLGGLIMLIDTLKMREFHTVQENWQKYLKLMEDSSRKIQHLLESLLEWAHLQMKNKEIRETKIHLSQVVDHMIGLYQTTAREKELLMHNHVSDEFFILADPNFLETIFRNLISNAIKYTHAGGDIIIGCESVDSDWLEIYVRDSGVGIPPEKLDSIFSLVNKASLPGTIGEKGSGFGLTLCQEMVAKMGGSIRVESEVAVGSSFYFRLKSFQTSI